MQNTITRLTLTLSSLCALNPQAFLQQAVNGYNPDILRMGFPLGRRRQTVVRQEVAIVQILEPASTRSVMDLFDNKLFQEQRIVYLDTLEPLLECAVKGRDQLIDEGHNLMALSPVRTHRTQGPLIVGVQPDRENRSLFLRLDMKFVDPMNIHAAKIWPVGTKFIGLALQ